MCWTISVRMFSSWIGTVWNDVLCTMMILIMTVIEEHNCIPWHNAKLNRTRLSIFTFRGANHTHPWHSHFHNAHSDSITNHGGHLKRCQLHPGCLPVKSGVTLISILHKWDMFTKPKQKSTYPAENFRCQLTVIGGLHIKHSRHYTQGRMISQSHRDICHFFRNFKHESSSLYKSSCLYVHSISSCNTWYETMFTCHFCISLAHDNLPLLTLLQNFPFIFLSRSLFLPPKIHCKGHG